MKLNFRPLAKADFQQFADWLAMPHVQKWWPEPATVEHVAKDYGPCTDGDLTDRVFVVQDADKPIGIIQTFMLSSYPEYKHLFPLKGAASIDYFIGELDYIGRGVGSQMIKQFIDTEVKLLYPDATGVTTSAELDNLASLGAIAKVGFTPGEIIPGDYGPERVMILKFKENS